MKLTRLRLVGFKSFVEPTDLLFEPGLTGVVGPNGCGKSNLVEALRWVMGESSHKNMRAAGMDEVIFAGSGHRPARNTAEVTLTIDNAERLAPAAFNDAESLEISRKIEREEGSLYRINGREVRARDVQILFADAATGARSPALVRQGQISEIIAAKPQARRRILEDAAGIAGLHARRHEAELRLKGADDNLVRVEDVLREIEAQIDNLKRQGRQASRYKNVSAEIRRLEALVFAIGHAEAQEQAAAAERQAADDLGAVAERTREQTEAATAQAVAAARSFPACARPRPQRPPPCSASSMPATSSTTRSGAPRSGWPSSSGTSPISTRTSPARRRSAPMPRPRSRGSKAKRRSWPRPRRASRTRRQRAASACGRPKPSSRRPRRPLPRCRRRSPISTPAAPPSSAPCARKRSARRASGPRGSGSSTTSMSSRTRWAAARLRTPCATKSPMPRA